MKNIGEIKKGRELGYVAEYNFIYAACLDCGKERWVQYQYGEPRFKRCFLCAHKIIGQQQKGEQNPNWRGGRYKSPDGYIYIWLSPDDFFYPMANHQGYVAEHRLVMAKHLNRCLLAWEIVHHKNGIRYENIKENLELFPARKYHTVDTVTKSHITRLGKRITLLEAENILLKEQIKQLQGCKLLSNIYNPSK